MTERRIYIGPSLPRWGLHFGMVFSGDFPASISEAMKKCPGIGGLIVPVSKTTASRAAALKTGSAINTRIAAVRAAYGKEE